MFKTLNAALQEFWSYYYKIEQEKPWNQEPVNNPEQQEEVKQKNFLEVADREMEKDIEMLGQLGITDKKLINYTWELEVDSMSFDQQMKSLDKHIRKYTFSE